MSEFEDSDELQVMLMKFEFYGLKQGQQESLIQFYERVCLLVDRLAGMKVRIDEGDVCFRLLSGLREEFSVLWTACLASGMKNLKMSNIKQQLSLEESNNDGWYIDSGANWNIETKGLSHVTK